MVKLYGWIKFSCWCFGVVFFFLSGGQNHSGPLGTSNPLTLRQIVLQLYESQVLLLLLVTCLVFSPWAHLYCDYLWWERPLCWGPELSCYVAFKQNQSFSLFCCFVLFFYVLKLRKMLNSRSRRFVFGRSLLRKLSSRPVKMNNFYHCLEKKHLQPRTQTNHLSLSAAFIMLQMLICLWLRNQLLCYLWFFHKSPYPCFVYVLPLVCVVISPPPADLAVVDVLGGECAIGDSRKAFRDTSILGYLSLLLQSLLGKWFMFRVLREKRKNKVANLDFCFISILLAVKCLNRWNQCAFDSFEQAELLHLPRLTLNYKLPLDPSTHPPQSMFFQAAVNKLKMK